LINYLRKPWGRYIKPDEISFDPSDSLNGVSSEEPQRDVNDNISILAHNTDRFNLYPYPKRGAHTALGIVDFPVRYRGKPNLPEDGEVIFESDEEAYSFQLTKEMNNLIARVQELEEALDDPADVWDRLREAWRNAEEDDEPRISEIVIQAGRMRPFLKDLEKKIRRMLRREREKVQLDRVQEMDRASMRWLSKQPGTTLAQRAGSDQRILAIVRNENFDTPENRVLHAYLRLAEREASEWLAVHERALETQRYKSVEKLKKVSRSFSAELRRLGVGIAAANITPNYVLSQDKNYKEVHKSWLRLLRKNTVLDDLWSWQGEIWTDFCALSIVLSLNELNEAELISQSPIIWRETPDHGQWFVQYQPFAIFWLRETKRIIEVLVRPHDIWLASKLRSAILLRVTEQDGNAEPKQVAVWTAHNLARSDFEGDAKAAAKFIAPLQPMHANLKNGIIITPSHGEFAHTHAEVKDKHVDLVALDPFGASLRFGMNKISSVLKSQALGR
jgi:hypothetical protein